MSITLQLEIEHNSIAPPQLVILLFDNFTLSLLTLIPENPLPQSLIWKFDISTLSDWIWNILLSDK